VPSLRAVIYVPSGADLDRWLTICAEVVDTHGWHLTAIVRRWSDATRLLRAGMLDLLVVGHPAHLDPDRIPRVVTAGDTPVPVTGAPAARRRPRIREG
jgi:hypothetical protein